MSSGVAALARRSTRILAASLVVSWIGIQVTAALSGIVVLDLTGDLSLVGLPFVFFSVGSALAAIPAGHAMDRWGRRPVLVVGHSVAALGQVVSVASIILESFQLFLVGNAILAAGFAAIFLTRIIAAELFPKARRGRGLALVVFSGSMGAVLAIPLLTGAKYAAELLGRSELLLAWSVLPLLALVAAFIVSRLDPDPKVIATQIQALDAERDPSATAVVAARTDRGAILAVGLVLMLAQGTMVGVMSIASASLKHDGFPTDLVGATMTGHLLGMYLLTPWIGMAGDRWGRRPLLFVSALVLAASTLALTAYPTGHVLAVCLFGIGVGWSFSFIGVTTMLADLTTVARRGRITGMVDMASSTTAALAAVGGGWALSQGGLRWVGAFGLALSGGILLATLFVVFRRTSTVPVPTSAGGS